MATSAKAVKKYLKTLKNIAIRVKAEEYERYKSFCTKNNITLRSFCLTAMDEYIDRTEKNLISLKIDSQKMATVKDFIKKENITINEFLNLAVNNYVEKDKKANDLAGIVKQTIMNNYGK